MSEIDWDDAPLDAPLWCVYGPTCFPTMFLCKVLDHPTVGRVIWGFSVYRGVRGFRTLGTGWEWMSRNEARLFPTRDDAFAFVSGLFPSATAQRAKEAGHGG